MLKSIVLALIAATVVAVDDMDKTMEEICLENGFRSEMHTVVTEDGYILTLYRIPGKFSDNLSEKKPAVLMVHA